MHYRIMTADYESDPDSADVVEAVSPEEAIAKFAEAEGWDPEGLVVEEYLPTMKHNCVCGASRTFTNLEHPAYPGNWQCDGCQETWGLPPDQINWRWERMFALGYVPCHCDRYDSDCVCGGAGWVRPEQLEDAWLDGDEWDYEAEY